MFRALHTRPEECKKGKQWTEDGGEGFCKKKCFLAFLFDENSTGECLCMDGKEVTCAWAPPAKFRSAKGNDYAGELLFFLQNHFCVSFFPSLQETGKVRRRGRVERK